MKTRNLPALLLLALALCLPWACASFLPAPQQSDLEHLPPQWKGWGLEDLEKGRRLYAGTCGRCHQLHPPGEYRADQWERITRRMQGRAKIDDQARESILAYLQTLAWNPAAAQKP